MEHRRAIQLLERAADSELSPEERRDLEAHLADCLTCQAYAERLSLLEHQLRGSLQRRYPIHADKNTAQVSVLEQFTKISRRDQMYKNVLRPLFSAALIFGLIALLVWSIQTFKPEQETGAPATATTTVSATIEQDSGLDQPPNQEETPTPTVEAMQDTEELVTSVLFPNVQFSVDAELPEISQRLSVYVQESPGAATLEQIRQAAMQFGLDSPIYTQTGEGHVPVYIVSDGFQMMNFVSGSSEIFHYWRNYGQSLSNSNDSLSFEQLAVVAEQYLKSVGLLEGDYRMEPIPGEQGGVRFVRMLDNYTVIYGIGYNPGLITQDVLFGADGEIQEIRYSPQNFLPRGEFPILAAEQAWQAFLNGQVGERMRYSVNESNSPGQPEAWIRQYPLGQSLDLYGYVSVLQPADPADTALVFFNNWPVRGDLAMDFADQASVYDFLHVWGVLDEESPGKIYLVLEGWEVSKKEDLSLMGLFERQGDQAWLESSAGRLQILDAPDELEHMASVFVRGVSLDQDVLDWSLIQRADPSPASFGMLDSCWGGGGGGGGGEDGQPPQVGIGGGNFRMVSLEPAPVDATATPLPMFGPYKVGDEVDGLEGDVNAIMHRYTDGSETLEINLASTFIARLSGPQVNSLELYQSLPVRVWGRVTGFLADGRPIIEIDRFEEVYPGLRIQVWIGVWKLAVLENKEVILFTAEDGRTYVLKHSIEWGIQTATGLEGDRVIIEGLSLPDDTYGGYPVIEEMSSSLAGDLTDLDEYEIISTQPGLWDESAEANNPGQFLSGKAVIERVELVYMAASLQRCNMTEQDIPPDAPWMIVQPVWRFMARFDDGRVFEIQIQALEDAYLR